MPPFFAQLNPSAAAVIFGLSASFIWGTADFSGGLAARRGQLFGVVLFSEIIGVIFMLALALILREALPPLSDLGWGAAAGFIGSIGVTALYASLAVGQMGINA